MFSSINNKEGFTLIEVLIAIAIIVIGILGILSIFPSSARLEKSSQIVTVATYLAQEKIEEIISKSYRDSEMSTGTVVESYGSIPGFERYKRITVINCYDPLSSATTGSDLGIKKIEVSLFWETPFGGPEKELNTITLISER